jgi:hypothetical protein
MDKNGQNRGGAREQVHRKVRLEFWDLFERQSETIATLVEQNHILEKQLSEQWEKRIMEFTEKEKLIKRHYELRNKLEDLSSKMMSVSELEAQLKFLTDDKEPVCRKKN